MDRRGLVTGSSGFVGHHLVEDLLNRGYIVIGVDSLTRKGDSQRLTFVNHPNYTNFKHDLRVQFSDALINKIGPIGTIFSIASDSSVGTSVEYPDDIINNNVQLILSVLDLTRKIKPNKFQLMKFMEKYGETSIKKGGNIILVTHTLLVKLHKIKLFFLIGEHMGYHLLLFIA